MRKLCMLLFVSGFVTACYSQNDSSVTRVYFDFGKSSLSESAAGELDKLISENGKIDKIRITGQTDAVGTDPVNDRLSLNRAREVYNYLVKKGLSASLAHEIVGYGKRNLVEAEDASNTAQLNRVVTITSYLKSQSASKNDRKQVPQKSFEQQVQEGTSNVVLNNLNFVGGRHALLPTALPVLENILATLKKYPKLEIEIQGHICCADSSQPDGMDADTNEMALSTNRAKAVYEYLVANGISASRMSYKGFGSRERLVYPEKSEEDYSMNRRVEFKIVKQ